MKTYKAIRTGQIVTILKEENDQVSIQFENGDVKEVTKNTLTRWYKPYGEVADEPVAETPVAAEPVLDITQPELNGMPEPEPTVKPAKASKKAVTAPKEKPAKKDPKPREIATKDTAIRAYLEAKAKALGYTLFSGKVKVFVAIKHEGSTLFAYTYNSTGVTLWTRSTALAGIECPPVEAKNHMFDARITLTADSAENRKVIDQLLVSTRTAMDAKAATKASKEAK